MSSRFIHVVTSGKVSFFLIFLKSELYSLGLTTWQLALMLRAFMTLQLAFIRASDSGDKIALKKERNHNTFAI
jgi:hypothetical protein